VAGSPTYNKLRGLCRKRGVLTEENIAWLEQVFRENVGKGKEEFTLDEFKKIVPSKNVSIEKSFRKLNKKAQRKTIHL
jgi:hypothetical protein